MRGCYHNCVDELYVNIRVIRHVNHVRGINITMVTMTNDCDDDGDDDNRKLKRRSWRLVRTRVPRGRRLIRPVVGGRSARDATRTARQTSAPSRRRSRRVWTPVRFAAPRTVVWWPSRPVTSRALWAGSRAIWIRALAPSAPPPQIRRNKQPVTPVHWYDIVYYVSIMFQIIYL